MTLSAAMALIKVEATHCVIECNKKPIFLSYPANFDTEVSDKHAE